MNALFPGTFDPFTFGHLDILNRSLNIFPFVHLGVIKNPRKKEWFTIKERKEMILNELKNNLKKTHLKKINVISFEGILIDLIQEQRIQFLIRGLRNIFDFQYEINFLKFHQDMLENKIETLFLFSHPNYSHISSSLIKELITLNAKTSLYISSEIRSAYQAKLLKQN